MAEPAWVLRTRRARAHRYRSRRIAPLWHQRMPPLAGRRILPIRLITLMLAPFLRWLRPARAQRAFASACAARAALEGIPVQQELAGWFQHPTDRQNTG